MIDRTEAYPAHALSLLMGDAVKLIPPQPLYSKEVTDDVTTIEWTPFSELINLGNVTFSGNSQLRSIGVRAFWHAPYLTTIDIPRTVETIEKLAFYKTALNAITFQNGSILKSIGDEAFAHSNLLSITIPDSVERVGSYTFQGMPNLTSVVFSENSRLTNIGMGAFRETPLTSIPIPNSVTTIDHLAFSCTKIRSVVIPDSIEFMDEKVFYRCPIDTIQINCNKQLEQNANNVVATLEGFLVGTRAPAKCHTLKLALTPSLVAGKTPEQMQQYVEGLLSIPTNNDIINIINGKAEKLFELDLSNTAITPADIEDARKSLPWTVIFADNERVTYPVSE
jgi:hypothetical protein